ncbi:MAG: hypothetical protein QOE93_130 [Actinomycetota bacterium]|jgi:hypothetical protein|nr:hypothetical protein [Actinomycetota bacterium]
MWSDEVERVLGPEPVAQLSMISVDEIRAQRDECRRVEDKVSYLRRLVQGRLDIVAADLRRRAAGTSPSDLASMVDQLPGILSDRVRGPGGGPGRLPSSFLPPDDDDLLAELDAVASPGTLDSLSSLSDDQVAELAAAFTELEHRVSERRRALFSRIDALAAELARRYKSGEASVGSVLG